MRSEEIERLLHEAGTAEVPPVDPAFADRLEQRLSAQRVLGPKPSRRPSPRWRLGAATVVAAAAAVTIAVVAWPTDPPGTVTLEAAADAEVILPGGTPLDAFDGLVVPDGAIVRTGPGGEVHTDDTVVGPNTEAEVVDGRLEVVESAAPATTDVPPPSSSVATTAAPPTTATTAPPAPATTAAPATTTTAPPTPATTAPPPARPETLRLAATGTERGVALRWSPYPDDGRRFAAYLVLRSPAPSPPDYPVGGTTVVVARVEDVSVTTFHEPRPPRAEPLYRVVAVDADGNELARSPAVRVMRR